MHAGLAEVAAAKARMFVNKPDGSKLCLLHDLEVFLKKGVVLQYAANYRYLACYFVEINQEC